MKLSNFKVWWGLEFGICRARSMQFSYILASSPSSSEALKKEMIRRNQLRLHGIFDKIFQTFSSYERNTQKRPFPDTHQLQNSKRSLSEIPAFGTISLIGKIENILGFSDKYLTDLWADYIKNISGPSKHLISTPVQRVKTPMAVKKVLISEVSWRYKAL